MGYFLFLQRSDVIPLAVIPAAISSFVMTTLQSCIHYSKTIDDELGRKRKSSGAVLKRWW